jgi:hypothetical protein
MNCVILFIIFENGKWNNIVCVVGLFSYCTDMRGEYMSAKAETSFGLSVPKTVDSVRYEIWDFHGGVAESSGILEW